MAVLTLNKTNKLDILSGAPFPSPFSVWWRQEESKDKKTQEITKSFIDIEPLFSFLQSRNCNIVNKEEITSFLENHINTIDYLYEAPAIIAKYFGGADLNLELVFDPEIKGHDGELFLNIETDLSPKKAVEKLDMIDGGWLLKKAGEYISEFNLNLEFI